MVYFIGPVIHLNSRFVYRLFLVWHLKEMECIHLQGTFAKLGQTHMFVAFIPLFQKLWPNYYLHNSHNANIVISLIYKEVWVVDSVYDVFVKNKIYNSVWYGNDILVNFVVST